MSRDRQGVLAQGEQIVVEEKPKRWELKKLAEVKTLQTEALPLERLREALEPTLME